MSLPSFSRRALLRDAVALASVTAMSGAALAQSKFPNHPIRIVVPYPPGALTDSLGRLIADRIGPVLGQPMIVDNRPGAGTLLGASQVAKSAPDGYNLLVATSTTLAISPAMFTSPPATAADFIGVAMIGSVSLLLITRPDLPVRNLAELVALLRSQPDKYYFASPGNGTMHHLLVEMILGEEKVKAEHVPYQGSKAALTDLLSGRIDFMFIDAVAGVPQIKSGKVKAIAVAAPKNLPALPEVPLVTETFPTIDLQAWQCVAAPRETPPEIVQQLNTDINEQLGTSEAREVLGRYGVQGNPMSVAKLNEFIKADVKRFASLIKQAGIKPS